MEINRVNVNIQITTGVAVAVPSSKALLEWPRDAVLVDDAIGAALVAVGVADLSRKKGSRLPKKP